MEVRRGLQAKMTLSYVAVTALAVLVVEIVVIGVVAPRAISQQNLETRVRATASGLASKLSVSTTQLGTLPSTHLGQPGARFKPGEAQPDANGGVVIPEIETSSCDAGPASFAILVSPNRRILATSYPACYRVGAELTALPTSAPQSFTRSTESGGTAGTRSGRVVWAADPVFLGSQAPGKGSPPSGKLPSGAPTTPAATQTTGAPTTAASTQAPGDQGKKFLGTVYLEVPASAKSSGGVNRSLVRTGLVLLALTIPLGVAFGLISTRRLTRRLKRLASSTLEVAEGSFDRRIPVSGHDEVSQLEGNFNRMAERLEASLVAERQLAGANARHEERSRIARELHDSISQDLFSLSMLAGGLRKALPADSAVLREVETMERTAGATMREMQALLLEIRPVALDEVGLSAALQELCEAYRERLGVEVVADVEAVALPTGLEHAVLRVAQEALANAVKHAGATNIRLRLHTGDGEVVLEVADDGQGFDPHEDGGTAGLGLRAMRDRVAEQGGDLHIGPAGDRGTGVRAAFPWRRT